MDHRRYELYMIELPTGRAYIGCTSGGWQQRWKAHAPQKAPSLYGHQGIIQVALYEAGKDNCKCSHIASAIGAENARAMENALIEQWGTKWPGGHNILRSAIRQEAADRDWLIVKYRPKPNWPPMQDAAA